MSKKLYSYRRNPHCKCPYCNRMIFYCNCSHCRITNNLCYHFVRFYEREITIQDYKKIFEVHKIEYVFVFENKVKE